MTDTHEVISAFLDGEAFEPTALGDALAEPGGRALLIDLIALRHLVQEGPVMRRTVEQRRIRRIAVAVAAAAVLVASVGGYALGQRHRSADADTPPEPTRVVTVTTGWQ
jgi:hypothetical protein